MSWGSSIFTGILTAIAGAVVAGFVATLAVSWYRISSFEAGSAAFVISFIVVGIVAGFLIGIVTSRTFGTAAGATFLKNLGVANAIVVGIAAVAGVSARLLADVPPKIGGEELMLAVELRWPDGQATSPASLSGEPSVQLGSVTGSNTMRESSRGPLWTEDARVVDGRWVAPGAVDIFTTRGRFTLHFVLDSTNVHAFIIPLRGRPGRKDMEWTEWYPHARPGSPPLPNGFTYRYRVQKRSAPVRTETIGPFEVQTIASHFVNELVDDRTVLGTVGEFKVKHHGTSVTVAAPSTDSPPAGSRMETADGVAVIAGPRPTLLAHFTDAEDRSGACYVLTDESDQLRMVHVPGCQSATGSILSSDSAAFRNGSRAVPRGRINRVAFEQPGVYVVGESVLDTRTLAVHAYSLPDEFSIVPAVAPLGISPDGRSFVRFGSHYDGGNRTSIAVADFIGKRSYLLNVDEARMRFATFDAIDPAWLMHHFEWQRGSDGVDTLVERTGFVPIPYHGRWAMEDSYWYEPAREPLRDAVIQFLVSEFKGEIVPVDSFAYEHPVKIGGEVLNVAYGESGNYVAVSLPNGVTDRKLLETVVRRLDQLFATGRYDDLFGK